MSKSKNPKQAKEPEAQPLPIVYSNIMRIGHSAHDFILEFSVKEFDSDTVIPRVRVHMSPQHTKAMLLAIAENIKKYEDKFDKINYPTDEQIRKRLESLGGGGEHEPPGRGV